MVKVKWIKNARDVVEYVASVGGREWGEQFPDPLTAFSVVVGRSLVFHRSVLYVEDRDDVGPYLDVLAERGCRGGVLVLSRRCDECPTATTKGDVYGLLELSEALERPLAARGDVQVRPVEVGDWVLPLYACIYRLVMPAREVPIVVAYPDAAREGSRASPDWSVLPTAHIPRLAADVVDVALPYLDPIAVQYGVLSSGYDYGTVYSVAPRATGLLEAVLRYANARVVVVGGGECDDPCSLRWRRLVRYCPPRAGPAPRLEADLCDRCGDCVATGCPAVGTSPSGLPTIADACTGCNACALICARDALVPSRIGPS